ncbi:MAG: hypothetical protein Sapg2KO_42960 [Saprospiraceae bacterium]
MMKFWINIVVLCFSLFYSVQLQSQAIRTIEDLVSITFYEQTIEPLAFTFLANSEELTSRIDGPLSSGRNDFQGWVGKEFYDVYYSDADGTFNPFGAYISITARFDVSDKGGGLNIRGVSLNFKNGASLLVNHLADYSFAGNYAEGTELNAVNCELKDWSTIGNTSQSEERLRLTVGTKNQISTYDYFGCQDDGFSIEINGKTYNENNPRGLELIEGMGTCDSLVLVRLLYDAPTHREATYIGCQGDGYQIVINGNVYDESNPFGIERLPSVDGTCDTLVTVKLTYRPIEMRYETYIGCKGDGYQIVINGNVYDESNPSGVEILPAIYNTCDTIITIDLNFAETDTTELQPLRTLENLASVTFYEQTITPLEFTFPADGPALNARFENRLNNSQNDFQGWNGNEFYDVFYSDCNGNFDIDGAYISITAQFDRTNTGGGLNIRGVGFNFNNGITIYANELASFFSAGNYLEGSASRAVNCNIFNWTTMGNTSQTNERLRITVGLKDLIKTFNYEGCQNDGYSLNVNGNIYNERNPRGAELVRSIFNGCDTLLYIDLNFQPESSRTIDYLGCKGDPFSVTVNGTVYNENNQFGREVVPNVDGICDSVIFIDLRYELDSPISRLETYNGCQGDGYRLMINDVIYDEFNPNGQELIISPLTCDTLVTIALEFNACNLDIDGCDFYEPNELITNSTYNDDLSQAGITLTSDAAGNVYFFGREDQNQSNNLRIYKVDSEGVILSTKTITTDSTFTLYPKDIITTQKGSILLLYYCSQPNPSPTRTNDYLLGLVELSSGLEEIQANFISLRGGSRRESARITQLSDGSFAVMSPIFESMDFAGLGGAILSRFDREFNPTLSMPLDGINLFVNRGFAKVEDDMLLIGSSIGDGAYLMKVNLMDSLVVWRDTLKEQRPIFNRLYNPILLSSKDAYGVVVNNGSDRDSLSGVKYYKLATDGTVLQERLFSDVPWSSFHWPAIVESSCQTVDIFYGLLDTINNQMTRRITLNLEGEVERDTIYDLAPGREYMTSYKKYRNGEVIGIGQTSIMDSATSIQQNLFVRLASACNCDITNINNSQKKQFSKLNVFPNPVGNTLQINLKDLDSNTADWYIFNLSGRLKAAGKTNATGGLHSIDVSAYSAGYYYIVVSNKDERYFANFIKQ